MKRGQERDYLIRLGSHLSDQITSPLSHSLRTSPGPSTSSSATRHRMNKLVQPYFVSSHARPVHISTSFFCCRFHMNPPSPRATSRVPSPPMVWSTNVTLSLACPIAPCRACPGAPHVPGPDPASSCIVRLRPRRILSPRPVAPTLAKLHAKTRCQAPLSPSPTRRMFDSICSSTRPHGASHSNVELCPFQSVSSPPSGS